MFVVSPPGKRLSDEMHSGTDADNVVPGVDNQVQLHYPEGTQGEAIETVRPYAKI